MSKANTKGKGKAPETTQLPAKGGDLAAAKDQKSKNAKPERTDNAKPAPGEGRGQAVQRGRGGGASGGAGRGGQQQQQRPGGRGGGASPTTGNDKGFAGKPEYANKFPRLDLEKENKQLTDLTSQIDAAYADMDEVRERIDAIQEERKSIQNKEHESRDLRADASSTKAKAFEDRDALRKALEQHVNARKRRLEEMNKQKKGLPISKDIKDTKKLVAANLEQLDREERAVEAKIKSAATTGQDRGASKELQAITAKKRLVREWAKLAAEAEAPVDPALEARLKQAEEQLKKIVEEEREAKKALDLQRDALQAKGDELGAAKLERSAIAQKVDKLKKDRDAVYAVIRDKRKEHQGKIRELQKAEREKKAVLDKEKRIKAKKDQREKALQELSEAFKDELALCDRLTTLLVNRQSKQQKKETAPKEEGSGEQQEEAKEIEAEEKKSEGEEGEEEETEEQQQEEEGEKDESNEEGAEEGQVAPAGSKKRAFQFNNATHIDFELLSVQPPTTLDEIPAALDSIARKKAFYERLAADKLELRKKMEAQFAAELEALESPTPKKAPRKAENGTAASPKPKAEKESKKEEEAEEDEDEEAETPADAEAQEAEDGDE